MFVDWTELGVPEGYAWPQLLYHSPTETVIVEVRPKEHEALGKRLLRRHRSDPKYQVVGNPAPSISYEDPVASDRHPLLFFNVMRMQRFEEEVSVSGDWDGVYRYDLSNPSKDPVRCLGEGDLQFPEPYDSGWVSTLLSCFDDGIRLHAVVGMSQNKGRTMEYYLAVLDLNSFEVQPLSLLRGTFF